MKVCPYAAGIASTLRRKRQVQTITPQSYSRFATA
jgi:hypothetical protein